MSDSEPAPRAAAPPEARLPRLDPDDVTGQTRTVFDAFVRSRGKVPNLFRVAAHNPPIVDTLHAHMQAVMGPGEVSQLLKELLSVRVSQINLCDY
jgi:alkylhydroperoxidase family enzyme